MTRESFNGKYANEIFFTIKRGVTYAQSYSPFISS